MLESIQCQARAEGLNLVAQLICRDRSVLVSVSLATVGFTRSATIDNE